MNSNRIKGRPVMIFFENMSDLNRFYQSDLFKDYQKETVTLH